MRVEPLRSPSTDLIPHQPRSPSTDLIPLQPRWRRFQDVVGIVYVMASIGMSFYSVALMDPYLVSDYFWPNFPSLNLSVLLPEVFNVQLTLAGSSRPTFVHLTQPSTAVQDTHAVCVSSAYSRRLLYQELTTLESAVTGLRRLDSDHVGYMITPYCYVDLAKRWELAHTAAWQTRCAANDGENAAVVLEAVLRNIRFDEWLDVVQNRFAVHIAVPVAATPGGSLWLAALEAHEWVPVTDEIATWESYGLRHFTLQYANRVQTGVQEAIAIVNAMGTATSLELKTIAAATRIPLWTSTYMYMCLSNDFDAIGANQSLVRNTPAFFGDTDPNQIEVFDVGYPLSALFHVVHSDLGPLSNIDLKWIAPPNDLVAFVRSWQALILTLVHTTPTISQAVSALGSAAMSPTPMKWANTSLVFYGGNPMCGFGEPLGFVQESFGFGDACSSQTRLDVGLTPFNSLFSYTVINGTVGAPCNLEAASGRLACVTRLAALQRAFEILPRYAFEPSVITATTSYELSIMQFVGNTSGIHIEEQRLLAHDFSFYGWAMIYDWVLNDREAVAFEGDERTLHLVSRAYPCVDAQRAAGKVLTWASYLRVCAYMCSSTFGVVGATSLGIFLLLRAPRGSHWFLFNRIASSVWLNRGVLAVRSFVATVCLATASLELHREPSGFTYLTPAPRSLIASCALAGETTWVTYLLHDLLQPITGRLTRRYAPVSTHIAWALVAAIDIWAPVIVSATIDRSCYSINMDMMIYCMSGVVAIGDFSRTVLIFGVNIGAVAVCLGVALAVLPSEPPATVGVPNLLLPPALIAFYKPIELKAVNGIWVDLTTASISGLFLLPRRGLFDAKLWLPFDGDGFVRDASASTICLPYCFRQARRGSLQRQGSRLSLHRRANPRLSSFFLGMGFIYLVLSLVGNITYLKVATANLANDYGWANFNSTGTRTFLANLFNAQLLTTTTAELELDAPRYADLSQLYNESVSSIVWAETMARRELYRHDISLATIIRGLRAMEPCSLPWMFTQYCWVDFNRTWEMAATDARQRRCNGQVANAAVFLEAPLRNVNSWVAWEDCWGESFQVGFAAHLTTSVEGNRWLSSVTAGAGTVPVEVEHWKLHNLSHFALQWQNFKTVGLVDAMTIVSALGWSFPLTLSKSLGSVHLAQQTSLKMYWSFASDLWAISCNTTSIGGASLVASSPVFAFANQSSESLLFENYTLVAPLSRGFAVLRTVLGPFNTVDMYYVGVPPSLLTTYNALIGAVATLLMTNSTAQDIFFALPVAPAMGGVPTALLAFPNLTTVGGNLLCGDDQPTYTLMFGLDCFFGIQNMCHASFFDSLKPTGLQLLFAVLAHTVRFPNATFDSVCAIEVYKRSLCVANYNATLQFLHEHHLPSLVQVNTAYDSVRALGIQVVQYLRRQPSAPLELFQQPLLDETDPGWSFYGWCYLYDWVSGLREVVAFAGDNATLPTISSRSSALTMAPAPGEIPETLSFLCQSCVQYITWLFITLAAVLVLSGISQGGHIEGLNLLELNRIVGHVWVGRALLVIRSITAFWLLNTSTLQLVQVGVGTRFVSPPLPWYNTILAGAESTWFVYVLNDLLSCVTLQYTTGYAFKSSLLAWAVVAVWSTVSPQTYRATINRACTFVDMDVQLVCESGTVYIGDPGRVGIGFLIGFLSVGGCFVLERCWMPDLAPRLVPSTLLNASSYYMLDFSDWVAKDEFYLDKTSALMAGVLALEIYGRLHVLDIKSWRYFNVLCDAVGIGYVVLSLVAWFWCHHVATPYLETNLFWPHFKSSELGPMLSCLLSTQLVLRPHWNPFDVTNTSLFISTTSGPSPVYPRLVMYHDLTTLSLAVTGLRSFATTEIAYMVSAYCWVDFKRRWELAHTADRQARCNARYNSNAAVYLEAVLRNIDFKAWMLLMPFEVTIGAAISTSADGAAWLKILANHILPPVEVEIALWTDHGLSSFHLQYANRIQIGIHETITITTALGTETSWVVSDIPAVFQGAGWTSSNLYACFANDLYAMGDNQTLVRNSANFFGHTDPLYMESYTVGSPLSVLYQAVHNGIGPLGSIDLFFIAPPPALVQVVEMYHQAVATANYAISTGTIVLAPTPPPWLNASLNFYGGNPMCGYGNPLPFIQETFAFDDVCAGQSPLTVEIAAANALFAMWILREPAVNACTIVLPETDTSCQMHLTSLARTFVELSRPPPAATASAVASVAALDLSIAQFVGDGTRVTLERHPIVGNTFELFGWTMVYDWVATAREVVSFQGDTNDFNLISAAYAFTSAPGVATSSSWTHFVGLYLILFDTVMLAIGVVTLALFVHHGCPRGSRWLLFNRIASSVWLNRTLVGLQSLVAVLCLSTASISARTEPISGIVHFVSSSRSPLESGILALQATWVVYSMHDVLHPVLGGRTNIAAGCSSVVAWLLVFALDVAVPVPVTAALDRSCYSVNMDFKLFCTSGYLTIGQLGRSLFLYTLLCASVLAGSAVALCTSSPRRYGCAPSLVLPLALVDFEDPRSTKAQRVDPVTAAMSGLLLLRRADTSFVFDTKLWLPLDTQFINASRERERLYLRDCFETKPMLGPSVGMIPVASSNLTFYRRHRVLLAAGLVYLAITLYTNMTYLATAQSHFANDFCWADFNSTGARTFLANIFNQQLLVSTSASVDLDAPRISDMKQFYNGSVTTIVWAESMARRELYRQDIHLSAIIRDLRDMDPCMLPWMFTQYCWLDFNRTWEMASTALRQQRCDTQMRANGAVYLEAGLRNLNDWTAWDVCWGMSFDVGIAQDLLASAKGEAWLRGVQTNRNCVADEAEFWRQHGITQFTLQWQNYKTVGLFDTMTIVTALGTAYTLALSKASGQLHPKRQTSMKMYWALASDFWAVRSNNTGISGLGLLRTSARFAFSNRSSESCLVQNQTLPMPLTAGFALSRAILGPFNAVDMQYVECPPELRTYYGTVIAAISTATLTHPSAQEAYRDLLVAEYILPTGPGVDNVTVTVGGNILCGNDVPSFPLNGGWSIFFGMDNPCHTYLSEALRPSTDLVVFTTGAILSQFGAIDTAAVCAMDASAVPSCADVYTAAIAFVDEYLALPSSTQLYATVQSLALERVQFVQANSTAPVSLFRQPIFAPDDAAWTFYSWVYLYAWASGLCDVVSFSGDTGTITTVSTAVRPLHMSADESELPNTISFLLQNCVKYITGVLMAVMAMVSAATLATGGDIEPLNLFEVNRIIGHVWIGRFLLVTRSFTAFWLLNTSTLQLVQVGNATRLLSPPLNWSTTILAGSEATWLVYVLNDVLSCITLQYTTGYAYKSSLLAWAATSLWATVTPQTYAAVLERSCTYVDMDAALVCTSGRVEIGSITRVGIGLLICFGSVACTYLLERWRRPAQPFKRLHTTLLDATSYYMLELSSEGADLFLDRPSGILAGIFSLRMSDNLHIFDTKSWRLVTVPVSSMGSRRIPLSRL
ncbi:hypothetical protein ACHHYP_13232 [Achlya hypogyna]|uniref:Uncharacterized protein n=1 Tax=Achlya hypogyna TaxID=1202772 RepID=A0A1V9YFT5_ACHHY|nr:hypothetical protein ACHHYP_13232 [Achlya hypogyna]